MLHKQDDYGPALVSLMNERTALRDKLDAQNLASIGLQAALGYLIGTVETFCEEGGQVSDLEWALHYAKRVHAAKGHSDAEIQF